MEYIPTTAQSIFDDNIQELSLTWITGHEGADRLMEEKTVRNSTSAADLVGHLNLIHPHRIQVLGQLEIDYYQSLSDEEEKDEMARLMRLMPPFILVAEGVDPPPELVLRCMRSSTPLFCTPISSATAIDNLRFYLTKLFAPKITVHGVFMDILGLGVLIMGESGLGKSELGLELISRGHGLVADDAVDFVRLGSDFIEGRCPKLLQNLLEVRGLGLLDIKTIFGETAVRRKMKLKLVVQLLRRNDGAFERLPIEQPSYEMLGLHIPKVSIQVVEGRNMAVLVEAAVRNTILKLRGIDTLRDFMERQREVMGGQSKSYL